MINKEDSPSCRTAKPFRVLLVGNQTLKLWSSALQGLQSQNVFSGGVWHAFSQFHCAVIVNASTNNKTCSLPPRMLYLVGLGLADETDITVKGLNVVKRAERVYLEAYTSILLVDKEKLVSLFSRIARSGMLIF